MTTQPKLEADPRQTNQNHHGPFYRSAELVALRTSILTIGVEQNEVVHETRYVPATF
jgi:hypothetical protein